MSASSRTLHLIDDRRTGGVTRFLDRVGEMRPGDGTRFVKRGSMRGHVHDAGTIVSHLAVSWRTLPMLITLRACNPSARIIHAEHSYCAGFEAHCLPARRQHRFHTLLRTVYALFDEVVAVSEGQARWMRAIGVVPDRKVRIAPPMVELTPFLDVADAVARRAPRYGFVGRLDRQKGLDAILPIWREAAPAAARFEIYGNGPMREELETLAGTDPRIAFHGATDSPAGVYRSFDIAVMPSRWEPFGLSCLEARAAGRPVMVAPVDGLPEQVSRGGGLVIHGGPDEWGALFAVDTALAAAPGQSDIARRTAIADASDARIRWARILAAGDGTAADPGAEGGRGEGLTRPRA